MNPWTLNLASAGLPGHPPVSPRRLRGRRPYSSRTVSAWQIAAPRWSRLPTRRSDRWQAMAAAAAPIAQLWAP